MQNSSPLRLTFVVDLLLLALSFPLLYFPNYFPAWALGCGFAALVGGWLWRRWKLGLWRVATPIDWPLFLLFFVMLPIAIWAAPETLRQQYSWPRAYILLWNFCLFWVVVTYGSLSWQLLRLCLAGFMGIGTAIAFVAPLGTNWLYKFAWLDPVLQRIPSPLIGVFRGTDSGFHPNQVAGTLLYVLPLMIALTVGSFRFSLYNRIGRWLLTSATTFGLLVFLATQSRSGLLGLVVGLVAMALLPTKRGQWILAIGIVALAMAAPFLPASLLTTVSDAPPLEAMGGMGTLGFRQEVWDAALHGIDAFPYTGMGLGTFRQVVRLLYPVAIDPNYDIAHAHNIFLQSALDFGIPGLIALLAIYLVAARQLWRNWQRNASSKVNNEALQGNHSQGNHSYVIGLAGSLIAQTVYSQLDLVAMGAKTNFMFWCLLALCMIDSTIDKTAAHKHP